MVNSGRGGVEGPLMTHMAMGFREASTKGLNCSLDLPGLRLIMVRTSPFGTTLGVLLSPYAIYFLPVIVWKLANGGQ